MLVSRRKDALKRDDPVQRQVGHHVVVRLIPAEGRDSTGVHLYLWGGIRGIEVTGCRNTVGKGVVHRSIRRSGGEVATHRVGMLRQLGLKQRHRRHPVRFADVVQTKSWTLAGADGDAALKIGQAEGAPSIAAEVRAQKRKQRRVLRDRKKLPAGHCPVLWRKVETDGPQFTDKRICHGSCLLDSSAQF